MKKIIVTIMVIGLLCACVFSSCSLITKKNDKALQTKNESLVAENSELKTSNEKLKKENVNLIFENETLSNANANLKTENDRLKQGIVGDENYKVVDMGKVYRINGIEKTTVNCASSSEIKSYAGHYACEYTPSRVNSFDSVNKYNVVGADGEKVVSFNVVGENYETSKISTITLRYDFGEEITEEDKEKFTSSTAVGTDSFYYFFEYEATENSEEKYDVVCVCYVSSVLAN